VDSKIDEFLSIYNQEVVRILAGRQVYNSDSGRKWLKAVKQAALQTASSKFPNLKTCIDARREQIGRMTSSKDYKTGMNEQESIGQTVLSKVAAYWRNVYINNDGDTIENGDLLSIYKKMCDGYEAIPPDNMITMFSDFDEDEIADARNGLIEIGYEFSQAGNLSTSISSNSYWFIVTKRPTEKEMKIVQLANLLGISTEKAKLAYDLISH